jgi:hypothetical protein
MALMVVTINKDLSVLFSLRPELCPASFFSPSADGLPGNETLWHHFAFDSGFTPFPATSISAKTSSQDHAWPATTVARREHGLWINGIMNEFEHDHKSRGDPNGGPIDHGHPPFWRRAHRDGRIWFCVIVMLAAMAVYLMTGDLRWRLHGQPQQMSQPISAPAGN